MADQNKVYALKVKEVYTKQAATEVERQRNWNAEQNAKNPIWAAYVGQLGWVHDQSYDNRTWACVQLLGRQGFGWIPRRCIDAGAVEAVTTKTYIPPFDGNPAVFNGSDLLSKIIGTLFQEMSRHSDALVEAGTSPEDIKLLSQSSNYMNAILKGMENSSSISLFKDGQPAWDRLWSLPAITPCDNHGGIYATLYWIRKDDDTWEYTFTAPVVVRVCDAILAFNVL